MEKIFKPGEELGEAMKKQTVWTCVLMIAGLLVMSVGGFVKYAYEEGGSYFGNPAEEQAIISKAEAAIYIGFFLLVIAGILFILACKRAKAIGQSAGATWIQLNEKTVSGKAFAYGGDTIDDLFYFEIDYNEIISITRRAMDIQSRDYATLILQTQKQKYCVAIDNSDVAKNEIIKIIEQSK